MPTGSRWEVNFAMPMPDVRLVGKGVIMPNSEGLYFPFEAIGLNKVDVEIFKIYNNNILQFLQNNPLNGDGYLYQVGQIVLQKSIPLQNLRADASMGKWTRYSLDLSDLIQDDPKAIYQVRIGFQPAYTFYECTYGNTADLKEPIPFTTNEDGTAASIMDGWYGIAGYYDGYNYRQRNDPCYTAYYNRDKFISRNVIASNLGIITKGSDDRNFSAIVTDLRSTDPVSGARLSYYNFQQQKIGEVTTDANGMATIQLEEYPFLVVAEQSQDYGYLRLMDGDALSTSRFDVSGQRTQKGLKGFLYADRGVWRPGDSIYLNFILEKSNGALPTNFPITLEVTDARGNLHVETTSIDNVNGIYPLHFKTDIASPTGNWIAKVKAGGANFTKTLKIETIRPNRLSVDLDFGAEYLSKANEPTQFSLSSNWLYGAPAKNLKAKVELTLTPANTTFTKYPEFEFDDPARRMASNTKVIFDGLLDGAGKANISKTLLTNSNAAGKLNAQFKTRVFEKGGNFSLNLESIAYYPYETFAGVALPQNEYKEKRLDKGKASNISFILVDQQGNPQANQSITVGLYRVNWRWWWENGGDNINQYNSSTHFNAQQTVTLTTDNNGRASWNLRIDDWGRYMIRVCNEKNGHCSGDFFYVGYPWDDDEAGRSQAAMLNFNTDKESYEVGENIQLTVPSGDAGRLLVTLETGSAILDQFWVEAQEGDNNINIKATEVMSPNVYVHVSLLQPHAQVQNDLPIRMYGVLPVKVENPATYLEPQIDMLKALRPEEPFTLQISEKNGSAMSYTIAVVDEGLLGLTSFKTPDPHSSFYAREALGIRTWDVYDQVLGAFGGQMNRLLSIGGDAAPDIPQENPDVNRFEPVVMHLGPFFLEAGKKKKHQLKMPNYVGAVRTMVVASYGSAYGSAEKTTPVKKPLMVLGSLPRVLGPGEQLKLPINVFSTSDKISTVTVDLETEGGLIQITDQSSKTIDLSATDQQIVEFDLLVAEQIGPVKFKITARGGGETATQEIELMVRNPNPVATDFQARVLDPGASWTAQIKRVGMSGTNEGTLELSTLPPLNLEERLSYLTRYPYGCIEQTISAAFPQLYVDNLIQLEEEDKKRIQENIEATINKLKNFQTSEGGFSYWPGENNANQWVTNYAGHFLLEAKAQGYTVPGSLINSWITFQRETSRLWSPRLSTYGFSSRRGNELDQAYRLYSLALAGQADLPGMNRLREINALSVQAQWRLAAAYAKAGKKAIAEKMIDNVNTEVASYKELGGTYGSDVRDKAMILETLVALGRRDEAADLVQYISDRLASESWYSTQTTAYSLLAVSKFVGEANVQAPLSFSYKVGNDPLKSAGSSDFPMMQIQLPVERRGGDPIVLENTGEGPLFVRVIQRGQPLTGRELNAANDLNMELSYQLPNGTNIDPGSIQQGTDFMAVVKVRHAAKKPFRFEELALAQIFPSGWEIINTRFDGLVSNQTESRPEYRDFRDDRVNTFFDLNPGETKLFVVQLNAAYKGRFYLPATSCEAMYDKSINAQRTGRWVEVTPPSSI